MHPELSTAVAHSRPTTAEYTHIKTKYPRNSNVEALRLLAMFCIALNHFPFGVRQGASLAQDEVVSLLTNFGGLGDCLFFIISAWYLCERTPSFRSSLRRVWILERQLLFYSLTLFGIYLLAGYVFNLGDVSTKYLLASAARAAFPFATSHWWFPTSYMLFLMILPFLSTGLRALPKEMHCTLVCLLLILYGFVPFRLDIVKLNMAYSIVLFLYLYIIVTFLRWHTPALLENRQIAKQIAIIGFACGTLIQIACMVPIHYVKPNNSFWQGWLNCPSCLPSILMALGLIILANTAKPKYNAAINRLASSTLAVYLILTDKNINALLTQALNQNPIEGWGKILLLIIGTALFYVAAIAIDLLRQLLFAITVDRNPGKWFDQLWDITVSSTLAHTTSQMVKLN